MGLGFIHHKGGSAWLKSKMSIPIKVDTKQSVYQSLSIESKDTVLLGDSILAFGEWSEINGWKNRAIPGDTTADILARLPTIEQGKPHVVILHCGINDLQNGIDVETTYRNYSEIVARLSKFARVLVLPILPVNKDLYVTHILKCCPEAHTPNQDDIIALNSGISALHGVKVIDLSAFLSNSELSAAYTLDGLHLNGAGLTELNKIILTSDPSFVTIQP